MDNNFNLLRLSDYTMTDGKCTGVIDTSDGFEPEKVVLINKRKNEIYENVSVSFCNEKQAYIFCVDMKDGAIGTGTWYPVCRNKDGEFYFSYRGIENERESGSLIELSAERLFFDPKTKTHYMGALTGSEGDVDEPGSLFTIRKWKDSFEGVNCYRITVKECTSDGKTIHMDIENKFRDNIYQAEMWAWNRFEKKIFRMLAAMEEKGKVASAVFSTDDFIKECGGLSDKNWEMFLVLNKNGSYCQYRFRYKDKKVNKISLDDSDRYILSEILPDSESVFSFYFDNISKFCAKVIPRKMMYRGMYRIEITDFDVSGHVLSIHLKQSGRGFENRRVILRHKDDDTGEMSEYSFGGNDDNECYVLNYNDVVWTPLRYELIMLADKDGYTYEFRIVGRSADFYKRLSNMYKYSYVNEDDMLIYITETIGKKVVLECRKRTVYDSLRYRLNEKIALLLRPLVYRLNKKAKYLMFYEKFCTAAQDNSYYMFEYFMSHPKKNIKPKYIIETKRPEFKQMRKQYGRCVVPFMSIRHLIYLQLAAAFVSTDSKRHCYRWRSGYTPIMQKFADKKFVFLQHGIVGFKKVDMIYGKQYGNKADIFIVASETERNIVEKNFGYAKKEIKITGMARWDKLENDIQDPPLIFAMPTWRNWIYEADSERFIASDFFREYRDLVGSKELSDMLEEYNVNMVVCLHPKFREFSGLLESHSDRIRIFDHSECKINEMLMKCSLFITDYSSAAWDVMYIDKPVLFYQFDIEKYNEWQGSYLDLRNKMFGYRAETFDVFLKELKRVLDNNFAESEGADALKDRYLPVRDTNNCKRVYEEVLIMLGEQ